MNVNLLTGFDEGGDVRGQQDDAFLDRQHAIARQERRVFIGGGRAMFFSHLLSAMGCEHARARSAQTQGTSVV